MTPEQIHASLNELPSSHTKLQIVGMVAALQADISLTEGLGFTQTVHRHSTAHKELFFSYPMLYRTVCRGTYRPVVLDILLDAKFAMDSGAKNKKEALDEVIQKSVDEVNVFRLNNKFPESK